MRLVPAVTGSGESALVTIRSAEVETVVVAVPLSLPGFPSPVSEVAVAVFVSTVPAATDGSTATVKVKTALPTAKEGLEQEIMPPEPTVGIVQDHPAMVDNDTNVVPAGRVSLQDAFAAALGPLFVTVIV